MKTKTLTLLKHSDDRRSVVFVVLTLVMQAAALWLEVAASNPLLTVALMAMTCASFVIHHNHIRTPVFRLGWLNVVFSLLISVASGLSSKFMIVPHSLNHHVHGSTAEDWGGWRVLR